MLQALERGPTTIDELLESIERDAGLSLDDEVESNIRRLVERLDALGLIEPVGS